MLRRMRMVGIGLVRGIQITTLTKSNSIKHSLAEMVGTNSEIARGTRIVNRGLCDWFSAFGGTDSGIPDPDVSGTLGVDRLPMDAWENWCKDGVICFGAMVYRMMKVYFVDPRNLSVYHVIDFDCFKFRRTYIGPGCILLGSKIYIIGGPTDNYVYFCDVSTPPEFRDGNYEWHWQQGPSLNSWKDCPLVFSLMGNIYVFSIDSDGSDLFEVLKYDSCHWEVLPPPPPSSIPYLHTVMSSSGISQGSFKFGGGKTIVICYDYTLLMYDAERNEWTMKELSIGDPFARYPVFNFTMDCLHEEFDPSEQVIYDLCGFCSQFFQACSLHPAAVEPQWHLFQLRGRKFCFIALCCDGDFDGDGNAKSCARVGTFDLVECSSDEQDFKHLKLGKSWYRVTDIKSKDTVLISSGAAMPYQYCSKAGTFSLC